MADPSATQVPDLSPAETVEQLTTARGASQRARNLLYRYPVLSPAAVLVLAIIVFGLINPRFVAPANLSLVTQQVAVTGILGIAQTLVILTAGIDLSVGALMVLSSLVIAKTATDQGVPPVVALALGLVVGALGGLVNGLLVTRLKLPPFIVTLGTFSIFTAITLLYSKSATVQGDRLPRLLTWPGETFSLAGVQVSFGVVLMVVLYALMAYVLGLTAWGRHVYAVGDDKEAARLSAIRVDRVLLGVYVVAGALLALCAWVQIGRSFGASPNAAADSNLESITAVVIGGTSLFGGRGTVWGTLLGALIVGACENGLALAGLSVQYQTLAVGILVIVAVSVDQWIRKAQQ